MRAKCKQCNKESLVAQKKHHHEKCSFSEESCVEDDERNMSEHAGSSGESILNIQDSEDSPPFRSPSFSILSELSANDSVLVTSCMSHSHSISPVAKEKKNLHHPETTIDKFVIRTSRLQKEVIDENVARFVYAPFRMIENPHFINMVQSLRPGYSPPNRADFAGKLLDKVYEREIQQCAKGLQGKIVNLSLDGWSNIHNDSVVCACVTTEEGNVLLTETSDTSGNAHTAEYFQEVAVKAITNCGKKIQMSSTQLGHRQCCKCIQDEKKLFRRESQANNIWLQCLFDSPSSQRLQCSRNKS
nr:uncharacterized protein LOC125644307 [Caretta caretta]